MTAGQTDGNQVPSTHESREEFLARMSDELLTPLNAVIGLSRVLEKNRGGNQRDEDLELLRRVRAGGEQLLRLVTHVLEQSRIARGQLNLALSPTDVAVLAARAVRSRRDAAAAKGLRIIAVVPESTPPVELDADRFSEVLDHLLDNAIKFTSKGTVRVVLVTDAATARPVRLTVVDSGIGIAPDRLAQMFEPFEQADVSASRHHKGLGLGLAIARRLCESMRCRLWASSEQGKGARFTVEFPR
jgi:signal transduction histidine kinase